MTRAFRHSYALERTHAADTAAMRSLIDGIPRVISINGVTVGDTAECPECFGRCGWHVYPSEHSFRTQWVDCETCDGAGCVAAGESDDE